MDKNIRDKYVIDFMDDFDQPELNEAKWFPFYLPQWNNRKSSKANYRIENSIITLYIDKNQKPWCPEYNKEVRVSSLQTGVFSGKLGSSEGQHHFSKHLLVREEQVQQKLYTPKFGYVEFRAKCNIAKNHVAAFWMIGFEEEPHKSAEICIFELKGYNVKANKSIIGYGVHPFGDNSIQDEFYEEELDINTREWNNYGIEWLDDRIHFYFNDRLIRTIKQSPQYEMQFIINIYDLENLNVYDASFDIDYVAGYVNKYRAMNE